MLIGSYPDPTRLSIGEGTGTRATLFRQIVGSTGTSTTLFQATKRLPVLRLRRGSFLAKATIASIIKGAFRRPALGAWIWHSFRCNLSIFLTASFGTTSFVG